MTSRTVAVGTGVAAIVALGVAVYQINHQSVTDAALASLRVERDTLVRQNDKLATTLAESKLGVASGAKRSPPPPSAPAQPPSITGAMPPSNSRQRVLADPSLRPLFLAQMGLELRTQYDPFFNAAGVSAEQREKFVNLAIKPMTMNLDLDQALAALGANPDPAAMAQLMANVKQQAAEAKADATDGMRQILGDQAYEQYQQYRNTLGERSAAERLAGQLYQSPAPMTAEQGSRLVDLLTQTRFDSKSATTSPANSMAGIAITPEEFANYTRGTNPSLGSLITDAAIARAPTVLTPDQLAALKRLQAQQLLEIQLQPDRPKRRGP